MEVKLLRPILLVISFIFFFTSKLDAQINMPYNMGIIGVNGGAVTTYSGIVSIEGHGCVVVKNGVQNLITNANGQYINSCFVNLQYGSELQFATFPNPASNYFIIKSVKKLDEINQLNFVVDLKNIVGQTVLKMNTNSTRLNAGLFINISSVPAGEYYIQIQSENIQTTILKMLKVN